MIPNKRFTVDCIEYYECSCPLIEGFCDNCYREFDTALCLFDSCDGEELGGDVV